jgi:four helix bundle protein
MARIERFEDIEAWKKARELTKFVYDASNQGVFLKDFALKDQMRRAVISITSNIAEGFERGGDQEFIQFLAIAKGSCGEARSQLYLAFDQGYLSQETFKRLCSDAESISRMIAGLMNYLKGSPLRGSKYTPQTP